MRVKKLFCSLFFLGIATCSLQKANATTNSSINSFAIDQEKFEECLEKMPHPWKGHRAFAEWLVKEIKPSQVVDLGVDYGFSTFIFANAAMKNGQGVVTGVDLFMGDPMTGFRDTYTEVMQIVNDLNFYNMEIIRGEFSEVSKTWDRPIDLLHIDGLHTYEAVLIDYNNWSSFVTENGIILFHDINVPENPDFQVVKFFRELSGGYKLYFLHSYGLGIFTKNEQLYEKIKNAFDNVYDDAKTPL